MKHRFPTVDQCWSQFHRGSQRDRFHSGHRVITRHQPHPPGVCIDAGPRNRSLVGVPATVWFLALDGLPEGIRAGRDAPFLVCADVR